MDSSGKRGGSPTDNQLSAVVRFHVEHDDVAYQGLFTGLDQRRLSFSTRKRLRIGQPLKLSILRLEEENEVQASSPVVAEVVNLEEQEGVFLVSAVLTKGRTAEFGGRSRRRHERHEVDLTGRYQRYEHRQYTPCRILDLSQRGVRFTCEEPIKVFNEINLVILPQAGGFLRRVMHTRMLVLRCTHFGRSRYEVAGTFQKISWRKAGEPAPAEDEASPDADEPNAT